MDYKKKIVPGSILGLLSPLALDIALPSLIFINIINNFEPTKSTNWWQLPLWWGFFTVISASLTFIFMFILQKKTRREFVVSLFFQNGIFFPLTVLSGIFGSDSQYVAFLALREDSNFYEKMEDARYYLEDWENMICSHENVICD